MKDKCIICTKETPYEDDSNIAQRYGYIEGVGQLCRSCYDGNIDANDICIPNSLVLDTPNDQELGEKIRRMMYAKDKHLFI
jgi:hypothetical protein